MTLLPPNATKFQRHLERANGITADTEKAVEKIKTIKSDPPDQILYWLIWEYGLGEILPYIKDLRRLLTDGLKWQRLRGTPKSLNIALDWIGISDAVIEEEPPGLYFYQYQLKLKDIPSKPEIANILNLSTLSSPMRARLSRLYNDDYDVRKLVLSAGPKSQFGLLLSDYSGYRSEDGLVLSFGHSQSIGFQYPEIEIACFKGRGSFRRIQYPDRPLLGSMQISDTAVPNWPAQHSRLSIIYYTRPDEAAITLNGFHWYGAWNRRTWSSPGFVDLGVNIETTHSRWVHVTEEIDIQASTQECSSHQVTAEVDESNRSHILTGRLVSTQIKQTNEEPLSSHPDWLGGWDMRTWASPFFVNIGVIHHGNTN